MIVFNCADWLLKQAMPQTGFIDIIDTEKTKKWIPNKKSYSSLLRKFAGYFAFVSLLEKRLKK